jgi:hypothetical protein
MAALIHVFHRMPDLAAYLDQLAEYHNPDHMGRRNASDLAYEKGQYHAYQDAARLVREAKFTFLPEPPEARE